MGIHRLETYLEKDVPNEYCKRVSIQELGHQYKQDSGRTPLMIVDGAYSLRTIYNEVKREWFLGGQLKEFTEAMKKFVQAFTDIGVDVMFYFDGASQEEKRDTWRIRKMEQMDDVEVLFGQLHSRNSCTNVGELRDSRYGRTFLLPPLIGAVGRYIPKYIFKCQVRVSSSECDAEMAEYAWKNGIFGILSRDTDFVLLRGARHYFSIERLDMETMTTVTYNKEGLKKSLSLEEHELLLMPALLGNDIVPFKKLHNFHEKHCPKKSRNIFILLPKIVKYIKEKKVPQDWNMECLREIAKDIFDDENMAEDLKMSIQSYLPPTVEQVHENQNENKDENWDKIVAFLQQKHLSCSLTTHLFPVIKGEAYELGVAIEDYRNHKRKSVARIYLPLRERIYGILLKEKKGTSHVKEWCVEYYRWPKKPYKARIRFIDNIDKLHPGILTLWSKNCNATIRWKLFAECLTQKGKIDLENLQKLGFPFAVPVAVLYYLTQEKRDLLQETQIAAILAHVAVLSEYSAEKLQDIPVFSKYNMKAIELSTVFHRGITTVLYLLAACGFDLEPAMPWHYFDGRLLHKKFVDAINGMRDLQLCEDKEAVYKLYSEMKELVLPLRSWRS